MSDYDILNDAFSALHSNLSGVKMESIDVESTPDCVYVSKYPLGAEHTLMTVLWRVAIKAHAKPWVIWKRGD